MAATSGRHNTYPRPTLWGWHGRPPEAEERQRVEPVSVVAPRNHVYAGDCSSGTCGSNQLGNGIGDGQPQGALCLQGGVGCLHRWVGRFGASAFAGPLASLDGRTEG